MEPQLPAAGPLFCGWPAGQFAPIINLELCPGDGVWDVCFNLSRYIYSQWNSQYCYYCFRDLLSLRLHVRFEMSSELVTCAGSLGPPKIAHRGVRHNESAWKIWTIHSIFRNGFNGCCPQERISIKHDKSRL
jgi:hypothetical protein